MFSSHANGFHHRVPLFLVTFKYTCYSRFLTLLVVIRVFSLGRCLTRFLKLFVCNTIGCVVGGGVAFRLAPWFLVFGSSIHPFAGLQQYRTLFLLRRNKRLSNVLRFRAMNCFQSVRTTTNGRFLYLRRFLLRLVLNKQCTYVFFRRATRPKMTRPRTKDCFFQYRQIFRLLFRRSTNFISLVRGMNVHRKIISSFVVSHARCVGSSAQGRLLMTHLFLENRFRCIFV